MKSKIVELSKAMENYVVGYEGNTSGRNDDGFLIKASGVALCKLQESDLVQCDINGHSEDLKKPSIETSFHSWLYKNLDIKFISHTHPTNVLKIMCSKDACKFAKKRLFPDQVVFNGVESCLVDYSHPGDELLNAIKNSFFKYKKRVGKIPKIILLRNHGIITFGKTIEECIVSTEICEKSAEIYLGCKGNTSFLKRSQVEKILKDKQEKYRQKIIRDEK